MLALRIVKHLDVVEHILPCFVSGFICFAAYAFTLEQVEKALDNRIVMTVSATAHAVFEIVLF
jgi:hypothetical protein